MQTKVNDISVDDLLVWLDEREKALGEIANALTERSVDHVVAKGSMEIAVATLREVSRHIHSERAELARSTANE